MQTSAFEVEDSRVAKGKHESPVRSTTSPYLPKHSPEAAAIREAGAKVRLKPIAAAIRASVGR